jgi:CBS domain-containing protein
MSRDVLRVEVNDTLGKCVKLMLTHDISGLPVMEKGKLVGIITKTDLIKALGAAWYQIG